VKVLVIEDNPTDSKLARAVVQMSGHHSLEQSSAEGALEALRAYRPDVILLDLNLPGMDGIRFAHELQHRRDTRSIPIVAVTAYPHQYRLVDVLSAGCAIRIIKPINTRKLVEQLQAVATNASRDGLP
jgi:two-component system, cell cycle response regulator DivK